MIFLPDISDNMQYTELYNNKWASGKEKKTLAEKA